MTPPKTVLRVRKIACRNIQIVSTHPPSFARAQINVYGLGMADAEIPFNRELFQRLCRSHRLWALSDCAEKFGGAASTIHRIQTGKHPPSLRLPNKDRQSLGPSAHPTPVPLALRGRPDTR